MKFRVRILIINKCVLDKEVDSFTVLLESGYRTFLARHASLVGVLDYGVAHYVNDGKTVYYAIHGGLINVKNNVVSLSVNAIEEASLIDVDRANKAKNRALERLNNKNDPNIDLKRATCALKRALTRLKARDFIN